jgi:hypothetical protein
MSGIMAPTQGAKLPSIPILIAFGINDFANTCADLVSNISALVSLAAASNASGDNACCPRSNTLSML